jgi:hypothetical protein
MRKIEREMNAAICDSRDWKSGNTEVTFDSATNESKVFLHGNHIATIGDDFVQIFDGGWQSATTKSRINAICSDHCIQGEGVFQKNFNWFVHKFVGQAGSSPVFNEVEFSNGFMFA